MAWKKDIKDLPRRELQRRAKKIGIAANQKSAVLIELLEAHERAMTAPDTPLRGDTHDVAAACAEGAGGARQAGPACGAPMQQGSVMQVKREGVPRAAAAAPPPAAQARAGGLFAVDEHAEMSPARLAAHSTLGQEAVAGTPGSDSDCVVTECFTADEAATNRARAAPSISLISPSPAKAAPEEITSRFVPLEVLDEAAERAEVEAEAGTAATTSNTADTATALFSPSLGASGVVRKEAAEVLGGTVKVLHQPGIEARASKAIARGKAARKQALAERRGINVVH